MNHFTYRADIDKVTFVCFLAHMSEQRQVGRFVTNRACWLPIQAGYPLLARVARALSLPTLWRSSALCRLVPSAFRFWVVSLWSICGGCISIIDGLVVIRVKVYSFWQHAFELVLVGQLTPTVEVNHLQSCLESEHCAILLTTGQNGQSLGLLLELSMKVLSGTILVRWSLFLYSALSAEHASIQDASCLLTSVKLKHGLFRLCLVCKAIYRTQLDCESTLVLG